MSPHRSTALRLVAAGALALLPGAATAQTNNTNQPFGGQGVSLTLGEAARTFIDCDPLASADCQVLNLAGCTRAGWPRDIQLYASLTSNIPCDDGDQRKVWISADAECNDTSSTVYFTPPKTLSSTDTQPGGTVNLCNRSSDKFPEEMLQDPPLSSDDFYGVDGGDACETGVYRTLYFCYAIGPAAEGNNENLLFGWHKFVVDTQPPGALDAADVTITPGDGRLTIDLAIPAEADVAGFTVRYRDGSSLAAPPCAAWPASSFQTQRSSSRSLTLTGLTNFQTYELCVVPHDAMANVGDASPVLTSMPREECDFWECLPPDLAGGFCAQSGGPALAPALLLALLLALARRRPS